MTLSLSSLLLSSLARRERERERKRETELRCPTPIGLVGSLFARKRYGKAGLEDTEREGKSDAP